MRVKDGHERSDRPLKNDGLSYRGYEERGDRPLKDDGLSHTGDGLSYKGG